MKEEIDSIYKKVLYGVSHGVILLDSNQKIILWNHWLEKHTKISAEEAIDKNLCEIYPEINNNIRLKTGLKWCLESGKYTLISERFGLSPLPLYSESKILMNPRIILNPIKYKDQFYCCFEIYDSSSYLAKEKFARNQTQKLKATQTSLVENSRLVALGEMAGGIAHEINTPLGIIVLRASQIKRILDKSPNDIDKVMEYSNLIVSVCQRIESIIKGLKHFARSGENDPYIKYSVKKIIQETILLCGTRFENHNIQINLENFDEDIEIVCRPVQISQVILNLLSNAQQALNKITDQKWITISFRHEGDFIKLIVTDNGPGIPEPIAGKIFQPFFTTKEFGEGTGLGLSISKGIIQEHGGDLILDRDSKNTRFVITLPKENSKKKI